MGCRIRGAGFRVGDSGMRTRGSRVPAKRVQGAVFRDGGASVEDLGFWA